MADSEQKNEGWERKLLEELAYSSLKEQRRARGWGIFFKLLTFSYLFILLFIVMGWVGGDGAPTSQKHTALIDLQGIISSDSASSAENINASLQEAFEDENTQGIVLRINSPGGSPVQAGYINDEIKKLRSEYPDIPLYAVISDVCASGGYYVAVAADKIFVDKASLVGSIGVLMDGFGFVGTLDKLGVERRLLTSVESKGFLDPFSPADTIQESHAQKIMTEIHEQFVNVVKQGRGDRLVDSPEIFSGLVWSGQKSIELGLADSLGSVDYVAREIIENENIVDFTTQQGLAERFMQRFSEVAINVLTNSVSGWELR